MGDLFLSFSATPSSQTMAEPIGNIAASPSSIFFLISLVVMND
jgi:hypothetical protein